jgi:hypothetical protein
VHSRKLVSIREGTKGGHRGKDDGQPESLDDLPSRQVGICAFDDCRPCGRGDFLAVPDRGVDVLDVGLSINVHDGGFGVGQLSTNRGRVRINTGLDWTVWCACGAGAEVVNTFNTWRLGRCGDVGSVHILQRGRILIAVC